MTLQRKFPHLSSPIQIGNITLKNRMISAPMAFPEIPVNGHLTKEAAAFFELRAKGGAALVTVSEAIVHSATGKSHNNHILLDSPGILAGLANTARAIQRHGAIASIELSHGGKYAAAHKVDKSAAKGVVRFGPSADVVEGGAEIKEMPCELIHQIIDSYRKGAALCKRAGFDMILIHGGHGWLIHQFLSPAHNRRIDEYGGSFENRARLALEIIEAVRESVGPAFPLEFRMSAEEYTEGGHTISEAIKFAQLIEDKIELLQVSTGSHENSFFKTHLPMFSPRGENVKYAAEIKKHVSVPVAAIGALNDPDMMNEIIASGQADVVEMARALLADPYLPKKVMLGKDEEIHYCMRCFTCMAERMVTDTRICAFNPIIGRELEANFSPPLTRPRKVLVAGGGPGGMQAAITAANRGHAVILCEKNIELGGALRCERSIPFKRDLFRFAATKALEMKNAGVEVRMNTEVTAEYVRSEKPDVLIVAVGAEPIIPPIPGIEGKNVLLANNLSEAGVNIGQRVVILGGGLVGCEMAAHLVQEGKTVTLVEMLSDVAMDANGRHRPILLNMLKPATILTHTRGVRVTDKGLVCVEKDGVEELIPGDTIICAVGQRPLRGVVTALLDSAPEVVEVGDCVKPRRVTEAVSRGYYAGLDI